MKILSKIFNSVKNKFTESIKITTNRFGLLLGGSSLMTLYLSNMLYPKTLPIFPVIMTALTTFLIIAISHGIFGNNFSKVKDNYKRDELAFTNILFLLSSTILVLFLWCKIENYYIITFLQPYLEYILFINFMIYIRSSQIVYKSRPPICCGWAIKQNYKSSINKAAPVIAEEEKELKLTHYFKK